VAFNNLGNHARGTETVRPSSETTVKASSPQETWVATASVLSTKAGIPFVQEQISVLEHQFSNHHQFAAAKATVRRQQNRMELELRIT